MLNCAWAGALTKYDCREVRGLDGVSGLEIGTPFSLPDGAAINLYVMPAGSHILISDNGDTLMQLSAMGIDAWNAAKMRSLRETVGMHNVTLSEAGDFRMLALPENAAFCFAQTVTALLSVNFWAHAQLRIEPKESNLAAEAEPYIVARRPLEKLIRHPKIRGASRTEHIFDFQHGSDIIDVIAPQPISTGSVMRKVGDVANGSFADDLSILVIVDDRSDPIRAESEMGILASIVRTMPFSRLTSALH